MGIDTGVATPNTMFDVATPLVLPGQTIHDYDNGDRSLPLWEVFTHSSNIGAARLGLRAGPATMGRYFTRFGLFAAAPSELVESARPLTPKVLIAQHRRLDVVRPRDLGEPAGHRHRHERHPRTAAIYRPLTLRKLEPGQEPAPGRRVIQEIDLRAPCST